MSSRGTNLLKNDEEKHKQERKQTRSDGVISGSMIIGEAIKLFGIKIA